MLFHHRGGGRGRDVSGDRQVGAGRRVVRLVERNHRLARQRRAASAACRRSAGHTGECRTRGDRRRRRADTRDRCTTLEDSTPSGGASARSRPARTPGAARCRRAGRSRHRATTSAPSPMPASNPRSPLRSANRRRCRWLRRSAAPNASRYPAGEATRSCRRGRRSLGSDCAVAPAPGSSSVAETTGWR